MIKEIKGHEGYFVSSEGKVYSDLRGERRELKPYLGRGGYWRLSLGGGKRGSYYIHRLVAAAFIPNPENKPTVNHKDSDRLNNNVDNLEWNTFSENNLHAYSQGNQVKTLGEDHKDSLLLNKQVLEIWDKALQGYRKVDLAKEYGVGVPVITQILRRASYASVTKNLPDIPKRSNSKKLSVSTVEWVCTKLQEGLTSPAVLAMASNSALKLHHIKDIKRRNTYKEISSKYVF